MNVVAIDGPAGAGKSTVARAVARRLGWRYLDTGALYRAVALAALRRRVPIDDGPSLADLAGGLEIALDGERTHLDGVDVTSELRASIVTETVSTVAAHPEVRAVLLGRQRTEARKGRVVIEGRDIGTRVVPEARVKVFLTASLPERARRRAEDLRIAPDTGALATLERELEARDRADASRAASPFARAPDALVIDSSGRSIEAVVDEIARVVGQAGS